MKKTYLETNRIKKPIQGVSEQTFSREYKGQSQMHVNTINGANLSSKGCKIMRKIYKSIKEDD